VAHRVLYLIDSLGIGGAERGLALTVRHLDRARVEPEVAYLWEPSTLRPEIEAAGARVHGIGARPGPAALATVPRVRRLLRDGGFDAIHTQVLWASIVGRLAGRLAGVAVISHIANAAPDGFQRAEMPAAIARKARLIARLDGWTGRLFVDRFVAISDAVRAAPIRGDSWDRSKIDVVLRGQELGTLRAAAELEPSPPLDDPGDPSIVVVGRLSEQKGHRYLIDAMRDIVALRPRARLLVCGDGHLRRALEERARPLGDRVVFLGIRSDVPALVARAAAFVFPSLWEGQGNALLEAMAVGAPIVATDIPSTRGTVVDGEQAILVPPGDARALAEAILRVVDDPALARRLGEAASRRADDYDIERTTRDLEAVYARILG
jgi:glycosyltransferase involved in cell wall biosynthesis